MIIRGRTLEQILAEPEAVEALQPDNINTVTVAPKRYNGGTPGLEVVWIGGRARELQEILADARSTPEQLNKAEETCVEIHTAVCTILGWIEQERGRL